MQYDLIHPYMSRACLFFVCRLACYLAFNSNLDLIFFYLVYYYSYWLTSRTVIARNCPKLHYILACYLFIANYNWIVCSISTHSSVVERSTSLSESTFHRRPGVSPGDTTCREGQVRFLVCAICLSSLQQINSTHGSMAERWTYKGLTCRSRGVNV